MDDVSAVFEHPAYRVVVEDEWDTILGHELWILPGDVLRLRVRTLYRDPKAREARGGGMIGFGPNWSSVCIANLNRAYRLFFQPIWYGVEIIYVPVAYFDLEPAMRDLYSPEEVVHNA